MSKGDKTITDDKKKLTWDDVDTSEEEMDFDDICDNPRTKYNEWIDSRVVVATKEDLEGLKETDAITIDESDTVSVVTELYDKGYLKDNFKVYVSCNCNIMKYFDVSWAFDKYCSDNMTRCMISFDDLNKEAMDQKDKEELLESPWNFKSCTTPPEDGIYSQ